MGPFLPIKDLGNLGMKLIFLEKAPINNKTSRLTLAKLHVPVLTSFIKTISSYKIY